MTTPTVSLGALPSPAIGATLERPLPCVTSPGSPRVTSGLALIPIDTTWIDGTQPIANPPQSPPPTTNTTNSLTLGAGASGTIAAAGDTYTYTFTGTAGETLNFNASASNSGIFGMLTDPSGGTVSGLNFLYVNLLPMTGDSTSFTLARTGTYTLTITGRPNSLFQYETGSFRFSLDAANPSAPNPLPLDGSHQTSTFTNGNVSTNIYQFGGTAGETVAFNIVSDSTNGNSELKLYDPAGNFLGYTPSSRGYFQITLTSTGTYTLAVSVHDPNNSTTTDSLVFDAFSIVSNEPAPITVGATVTGKVAAAGVQNVYSFTGTAGETLVYKGLAADQNLFAELIGPSGNAIPIGNNLYAVVIPAGSTSAPVDLSQTGTYQLVIGGHRDATGNYSFDLIG